MKQDLGEASVSVLLLLEEYGLVRVRAQSARRSEGKLRYSLEPLTEGFYSFVRGTQANRLVGAEAHTLLLNREATAARRAAGQISRLLLRLLPGEEYNPELFRSVREGFVFLSTCPLADIPEAECMLVLSVLAKVGYLPEEASLAQFAHAPLTSELIAQMRTVRPLAVRAINQALSLSGL
jgi:recombinational DNA repair protein (RecF pathway)